MRKSIFIIVAILFVFNILSAQLTENVFIVVIDGARYTETFGDSTHQYIPKIWNDLRPSGTIYTSFYIDGQTSTNPGHASIITGTWQNLSNDGSQRPNKPTLFEYSRKQKSTAAADNYVILGKLKLDILSHSTHGEYGSSYTASVKSSSYVDQYNDTATNNNVMEVINDDHPNLVIINFPQTDTQGHTGVWNNYVNAIHNVDNLIYELWTFIQDDSIYANKTTMFVTNDHGRHSTNFVDHGDNCEGCRHIMLLAIGPDTPAGIVDTTTRKQIDIAPTIGHLLRLDTPYCTGNVINTAIATDIAVWNSNILNANSFSLSQNFPNPFNPLTKISFYIPKSNHVTLKVFSTSGQRIVTLLNRTIIAGSHNVEFNASALPSGNYFYRIQAGEFYEVKKMVLIK